METLSENIWAPSERLGGEKLWPDVGAPERLPDSSTVGKDTSETQSVGNIVKGSSYIHLGELLIWEKVRREGKGWGGERREASEKSSKKSIKSRKKSREKLTKTH